MAMLSIALMAIDHRQHHVENIRAGLSVLIYPLQYLVSLPVETGDWMKETFASRETLLEENARLRMQETLYKAQLQKFTALKTENQRLRELLQSSEKIGERILIAELLAVDMDPFTRQIVINKGSRDGVFLGQPLLAAEGVMGQVIHVGPFSANAMLITDPNHAIPVQVDRTGLRGIAIGTGSPDHLEVPYLPLSADIVEGDLLITSGLGGRFPPDYPVAVVTRVEKLAGQPYARVEVKPTALLDHSREVLLVWVDQPHGNATAAAEAPSASTSADTESTP
jgi:rod shape-determining protein MreC